MTTKTILTNDDIYDLGLNHDVNGPYSFARAIEQAVLQSPEIQQVMKDAERCDEYRKLLEGAAAVLANCADDMRGEGDEIGGHEAQSMADVINAAMEQQI